MKNALNHRERLEMVLNGEKPDRIPISFWRHFPVDDQSPQVLAKRVLDYQARNDFDFVKVTPASSFCLYDYGIRDEWKGNSEGTREYSTPFLNDPKSINKIFLLDPTKGRLADQKHCLSLIKSNLPQTTPIIQTIFAPLAQLKNIVGKSHLAAFLRLYPEETKAILENITKTTIRFIDECKKEEIDGIFFAVQAASYDILSEAEFVEFGRTFDLQILSTIQDLWLNLLHIHGENIMFERVMDYPCQIINWHDRETPPSLLKAQQKCNKVLCGGMKRIETMVLGDRKIIQNEIQEAMIQTKGIRFILSTGCVLLLTTPQGNLDDVREIVNHI
jgi:uroporphyrinogen decarboxylase